MDKCLNCGTKINNIRYKQKHCSTKCYLQFNREKMSERSIKYYYEKVKPNRKKPLEDERYCKNCNKIFIWSSSIPRQIYCSKLCGDEYQKYNIIKEGKYNGYYKLRFEIFKRDNFTCQYCGRNVKEDKIKLNCDHIHPHSKGGLFIPQNLITSCMECNLGKSDVLLEKNSLI